MMKLFQYDEIKERITNPSKKYVWCNLKINNIKKLLTALNV